MRGIAIVTVFTAVLLSIASAEDRLAAESYFQGIQGHWLGEGSLTNADGEVTSISEDWTGAYLDDGSFELKGTRLWGEDQQEFYWKYTHNQLLDLLECEYWHTGVENPVRFEVSLSELEVEMRAPFGDPGGELKIHNSLDEDGIRGIVTLTQGSGVEVLSGEVVHKKVLED